jgi:hypothetical protein
MNYTKDKISLISNSVDYQFPSFVREDNLLFVSFLKNYYKSLESKFQPLDLVSNLIEYYNIEYFTPTNLVKSTTLTSLIGNDTVTIPVKSTKGFPERDGFIKIGSEIIYYKSKTNTSFIGCKRGSSAFTFLDRKRGTLNYTTSTKSAHSNNSEVLNLGHIFAEEFFKRAKSELIPNIPEYINPSVNYVTILQNIKSFYLSKGSLDSFKFFFRILFNEREVVLNLSPRGSGASIIVSIFNGQIDKYQIVDGGSGYSQDPEQFPIVEIYGSGEGGLMRVTSVNSSGEIEELEIVDSGENYRGQIEIVVREKQFTQEQFVTGLSSGAIGFVKFWEPSINKLTLVNVSNNFLDGEIILGTTDQSSVDNNIKADLINYEIIPIDPTIEYPNELLFTPSNALYVRKEYVKCEVLEGDPDNVFSGQGYYLEQQADPSYGVKNTKIGVGIINKIYQTNEKTIVELSLENKPQGSDFYLPPSTKLNSISGTTLTVDNTVGFPIENGIIQIGQEYILYQTKTVNQFLGCTRGYLNTTQVSHSGGVIIDCVGRKKSATENIFYDLKLYTSDENTVLTLKLLGLPGEFLIDDPGCLLSNSILEEGTDFTVQNTNPLYSEWRITEDSTGINSVYDYGDAVYIAASSIPDYVTNQSRTITNQKIVRRIPKNIKPISSNEEFFNLGVTNSGVEILNTAGKKLSYGSIVKFNIQNPGKDYLVTEQTETKPKIIVDSNNTEPKLLLNPPELKINGSFISVSLDNITTEQLSGFTTKPSILIQNNPLDTTGNSAALDCIFTNGVVKKIIVTSAGSRYTHIPTITISGGGKSEVVTIPIANILIKGGLFFDAPDQSSLSVNIGTSYNTTPPVRVTTGEDGQISSEVLNGSLTALLIGNQGENYVLPPQLKITGTGFGAKAICFVANGKITGTEIIDPGYGYVFPPLVEIIPIGVDATITTTITQWQYNLGQSLPLDNAGGYVYSAAEKDIIDSKFFDTAVDRNGYYNFKCGTALETAYGVTPGVHSPIIGWAYDGNPIYGRYGYTNPYDSTSQVVEVTGGYQLINTIPANRPSTTQYPLGYFVEDWKFNPDISTLDKNNGRFCKTPEYPNGTYCYFATSTYPYFVSPVLHNDIDKYNVNRCRLNDSIPKHFTRVKYENDIYYPEPQNLSDKTRAKISSFSVGSVDSVYIETPGINYRVGEKLIVNNDGTNGSGFSGIISAVKGVNIQSLTNNLSNNIVTVVTSTDHGLESGSTVFIKPTTFDLQTVFDAYTITASNSTVTIDGNSNVTDLHLFKNKRYTFTLSNLTNYQIYLALDVNGNIPYYDEDSVITGTNIDLITTKVPTILHLITYNTSTDTVVNSIQLTTKKEPYLGKFTISKVNNTSFYYKMDYSYPSTNIDHVYYSTNNRTVLGSIDDIRIYDGGVNYKILPKIEGIETQFGTDAILLPDSNTIGKIKSLSYQNTGDYYPANKTINYNIKSDIVVKVINNLEIYEVEVTNPGFNYLSEPRVYVEGYEDSDDFEFQTKVLNGRLVGVDIIKGGSFLEKNPTLIVDSLNTGGSGAVIKSKVRRKTINIGTNIYYGPDFMNASTVYGKIVNFEPNGSMMQITENYNVGKFEQNNSYKLFDQFGNDYGKIIRIIRPKISFKSGYSVSGSSYFATNSGFLNTDSQRIQDGKYYQKYSYVVNFDKNITDWRNDVNKNIHPVGFKLFAKNRVESYKAVHEASQKIVRNILGFTLSLRGNIQLKIQDYLDARSRYSTKQQLLFVSGADTGDLKLDDYIFGSTSKTLGKVIEIFPGAIKVELLNDTEFVKFEYLLIVKDSYPLAIVSTATQTNALVSANGVLQNPLSAYKIFDSKLISTYPLEYADNVVVQKLNSVNFDTIQPVYTDNSSNFILTTSQGIYLPSSKNSLIFSVNGVVQDPSNFQLSGGTVSLSETVGNNAELFSIYSNSFQKLTFTQVNATTYNISPSVTNKNQLLIFSNGAEQSVVDVSSFTLNGAGNQITFTGTVFDIFGWKLNDTVQAEKLDLSYIGSYQIFGYNNIFRDKNLTYKIETNNVKNPENFYEIERKKISGFLYSSGNNVYGVNTKFKYSNPEYSASYVEVLNELNSFNGVQTSFKLTYLNNVDYTNSNSDSFCVNLNNSVLTQGIDYTISGSNIIFTNPPASGSKCTITVFNSTFASTDVDALNKSFDGSTTTFSLVKDGVPLYVYRQGDVIVFRNNVLQKLSTSHYSINDDKITFVDPVLPGENVKLLHFRRLLDPANHHNFLLDDFRYYDNVTTKFALTSNGETVSGNTNNLMIFRNGVYQHQSVAYTANTNSITFLDAPSANEEIHGKAFVNNSTQSISFNNRTSTQITLTGSPNITAGVIFIFLDGVMQSLDVSNNISRGFTYNNTSKVVTFDESISAVSQITVLWFKTTTPIVDDITLSTNLTYTIRSNGISYSPSNKGGLLVMVDGVVQKYTIDPLLPGSYTINSDQITFSETSDLNTGSVVSLYYLGDDTKHLDEMNETVDGIRKKYRMITDFSSYFVTADDLIVSVNGVVQKPFEDYTTSNGYITFDTAPTLNDEIFMIALYGNVAPVMTYVSGNTWSIPVTLTEDQKQSTVIFYNGAPQFINQGFTVSGNLITFDGPLDVGLGAKLFMFVLTGAYLTDEIDTPFDGVRTMFTMFKNSQVYYPVDGEIAPQNVFVTKNGKVLESGVDYTITTPGSRIIFTVAPLSTDKIDIRCFGEFIKLDNITTTTATTYNIKKSTVDYYPNAVIDRPRNYENQILVTYDSTLLSPLRDYYIENNKLVLTFTPTSNKKIVITDYQGYYEDVEVKDYYENVLVGDKIQINGETDRRTVTAVLSPTVLTTSNTPTNLQVNFSGTANISGGRVTSITVNNTGRNYSRDTYIVPFGCGSESLCQVVVSEYGEITSVPTIIGGYNYYVQPSLKVVNTGYVINQRPLQQSQMQRLYKLQSNINSSIDNQIQLNSTTNLPTSPWTLTATSSTGSGAILVPHISRGSVVKVTVINGGTGYTDTDIQVRLTGGTSADGRGASFEPILDTVTGAITGVTVKRGGRGYTSYRLIIGREMIEYTQTNSGYLRGCTRGAFSTIAASHTTSEYVIHDSLL